MPRNICLLSVDLEAIAQTDYNKKKRAVARWIVDSRYRHGGGKKQIATPAGI